MPGSDIYFDFQLPGSDKKTGNIDWSFQPAEFPDLPEGEIDIDIEVYVGDAIDEGAIGDIIISGGDAPTVRIPVDTIFVEQSEFTYKVESLGPKNTVVFYKTGTEIGRSSTSFASSIDELKEEGFLNLEASHPGIRSAAFVA